MPTLSHNRSKIFLASLVHSLALMVKGACNANLRAINSIRNGKAMA
jgi:hypothetical protein